jgi:hypothetical protein
MREKKPRPKQKRKKAKPDLSQPFAAALSSMAVKNLVNMLAVMSVSGAVLLTLLAANRF